jgi:hypothetical protein
MTVSLDSCRSVSVPVQHMTLEVLEAGLAAIHQSPKDEGLVQLIVRRPQIGEREVLHEAQLDLVEGLLGDNWKSRGSTATADGSAHPHMQLNLMNSRVIALLAQDKEHWPLAGDQFFVDLDLSATNLRPGTQLALGSAVIEVTAQPHTGCKKFLQRFGIDALKFVNSPLGRELNLRGINAKIIRPGTARVGDMVQKLICSGAARIPK